MPAPAAPRPRRLETLARSAIGRPKPAQQKAQEKCCDSPKIENDGDMKVCMNCGKLFEESNIVADVTFSEDARGAATVQGGFVGENARHARTLNTTALRRLGGSERNAFAEIESNGRRVLNSLCPSLNIAELVQNQAANIWSLAAKNNFNAGRRTDEVVASCLYAACRRQPSNEILMIDISEKINTSPFRLGIVYKDLCQTLYLGGDELSGQYQVEIEPLIMKYCRQLQFTDKTRQVAEDAIKIVRRMDRDWMTSGRHPAGLCGACIILAARMNNFHRSVREVVLVAKVADATIMKRVEEFRRTKSAAMTVEDFRKYGPLLKHQADPPSLSASEERRQKMESTRKRRKIRRSTGTAVADPENIDPTIDPSLNDSTTSSPQQSAIDVNEDYDSEDDTEVNDTPASGERRLDADGFAIPALPPPKVNSNQSEETRRGRPKKSQEAPEPLKFSLEELITEEQLLKEIERNLSDEPVMQIVESEIEIEKARRSAEALAQQQRKLHREQNAARRAAEGLAHAEHHDNGAREIVTAEELEAEFADDPEVNHCILNEEESRIKEQIWVSHNETWMRQQHEKDLIKRIEGARGSKHKTKKGNKGKRKKGRLGDGSLLNEATTPINSPADAMRAMLAKNADREFSKFVDYDVIERIFGDGRSTASASRSNSISRAGTPAPPAAVSKSAVSEQHTAAETTQDVDNDEEDDYDDDPDSPVGSQWGDDGYDDDGDDGGAERDYDASLDNLGGASFETYE